MSEPEPTRQSFDPAPEAPEDEIIVEGYSARYGAAVRHVLQIEGGWVNDPVDRGGATKFGISLRFLASEGAFDSNRDGIADFDLDMDGDIDAADVRALRRGDAVYLYHRCFWLPIEAEGLPAPLGEMMFDQAVNAGKGAARKLLQRSLNSCIMRAPANQARPLLLKVDGTAGKATRAVLQWVIRHPALGIDLLVDTYRDAVRERYRAIAARFPSQKRFLKGWLNRADRLGRA